MTVTTHRCPTPDATEQLGASLAGLLQAGDMLLLEGDLAAGKTTLVRGLTAGLGGKPDAVSSPTFVIIQTYACARPPVRRLHHIDLYRLDDSTRTLGELGLEELLSEPDAVTAVEWPKGTIAARLPACARLWRIRISSGPDDLRVVVVTEPAVRPPRP